MCLPLQAHERTHARGGGGGGAQGLHPQAPSRWNGNAACLPIQEHMARPLQHDGTVAISGVARRCPRRCLLGAPPYHPPYPFGRSLCKSLRAPTDVSVMDGRMRCQCPPVRSGCSWQARIHTPCTCVPLRAYLHPCSVEGLSLLAVTPTPPCRNYCSTSRLRCSCRPSALASACGDMLAAVRGYQQGLALHVH